MTSRIDEAHDGLLDAAERIRAARAGKAEADIQVGLAADPVTALANVVTAITGLVHTVIASQPPDVQKQLWEWYIADVKWWRKVFKIDN